MNKTHIPKERNTPEGITASRNLLSGMEITSRKYIPASESKSGWPEIELTAEPIDRDIIT